MYTRPRRNVQRKKIVLDEDSSEDFSNEDLLQTATKTEDGKLTATKDEPITELPNQEIPVLSETKIAEPKVPTPVKEKEVKDKDNKEIKEKSKLKKDTKESQGSSIADEER